MVEAVSNGQVIGHSGDSVVEEGDHYFPPGDVDQQFLRRSMVKSLCPWKVVASYDTVAAAGRRGRNAAWTYRYPSPLAREDQSHVAFRGRVSIRDVG